MGVIVFAGGGERRLQPSARPLPSPTPGGDIAAATKEEVETAVEEQVANTLPCTARDLTKRGKLIPGGLFCFAFVELGTQRREAAEQTRGCFPWRGQY